MRYLRGLSVPNINSMNMDDVGPLSEVLAGQPDELVNVQPSIANPGSAGEFGMARCWQNFHDPSHDRLLERIRNLPTEISLSS